MNKMFANDIRNGLGKSPKSLSSKYFYDEEGSVLFSEIMKLPEYYLTDAEFEIFQKKAIDIVNFLELSKEKSFELIELGAGDGYKTIELLKAFDEGGYKYQYSPIDISKKALDQIKKNIQQQIPNKKINLRLGDYFHILNELQSSPSVKVILFLGSNIGNMEDNVANTFLQNLGATLSTGDKVVLGVDLQKSKEIVLPAYDDSEGVTSAFNLNLLKRINREFQADFDLNKFEHAPSYDEKEGIAKSGIKSMIDQQVEIKALNMKVDFKKEEVIKTEVSRKYNDEVVNKICANTGLNIPGKFTDSNDYFADYILEKE